MAAIRCRGVFANQRAELTLSNFTCSKFVRCLDQEIQIQGDVRAHYHRPPLNPGRTARWTIGCFCSTAAVGPVESRCVTQPQTSPHKYRRFLSLTAVSHSTLSSFFTAEVVDSENSFPSRPNALRSSCIRFSVSASCVPGTSTTPRVRQASTALAHVNFVW